MRENQKDKMNQRWGSKKELDDDRERKMKRRKNKKTKEEEPDDGTLEELTSR